MEDQNLQDGYRKLNLDMKIIKQLIFYFVGVFIGAFISCVAFAKGMSLPVQTTTSACTSVLCLMVGFLVDIKDLLSAILVLVSIAVGITALLLNIRSLKKK